MDNKGKEESSFSLSFFLVISL